MNTQNFNKSTLILFLLVFTFSSTLYAQKWNPERLKESKEALSEMVEASPKLQAFVDKSYGYVVFPKVTKAAVGLGGAAGTGIVFKSGVDVGSSKLKQASVGFQLGGEQYSEAIFFENQKSYDNFINGKLKFDAKASAVAITAGASIDASYQDGVAVFTRTKGGLMYQAAIGGQHFKYEPKE